MITENNNLKFKRELTDSIVKKIKECTFIGEKNERNYNCIKK